MNVMLLTDPSHHDPSFMFKEGQQSANWQDLEYMGFRTEIETKHGIPNSYAIRVIKRG